MKYSSIYPEFMRELQTFIRILDILDENDNVDLKLKEYCVGKIKHIVKTMDDLRL